MLAGLLSRWLAGWLSYWLAGLLAGRSLGSIWEASRGADAETGSPERVQLEALEEALCCRCSLHWRALEADLVGIGP